MIASRIWETFDQLMQAVPGDSLSSEGLNASDNVHRGGGGDGKRGQQAEMVAWQHNEAVLRWKTAARKNVLTHPEPGKWGT